VIHVRPFAPTDLEALLGLLDEQLAHEGLPPHTAEERARLADAALAIQPRFEVLVAERDGRVIGCALFLPGYSTFKARPGLFLDDLVVSSDARGAGAGTALFRACARVCLERGWSYLEWQVSERNPRALAFYRRHGARVLEGWLSERLDGAALQALAASPAPP
jgi:GNAT superfamily N-acetyltransferase